MDYLLHIFALVTAWIALFINTEYKEKKSLKYLIATLALIVFCVSNVKSYYDGKAQESLLSKIEFLEQNEKNKKRIVYQKYLSLYQGVWNAPNLLKPGAIIEFNGFECELDFGYGAHSVSIPNTKSQPHKFTIMSMAGEFKSPSSYEWYVYIKDKSRCSGQLHVYSTDDLIVSNR